MLGCTHQHDWSPLQARSVGYKLLSRLIKLHYNWKYLCLRPTVQQIVKRYREKYGNSDSAAEAPAPAEAPVPATPP